MIRLIQPPFVQLNAPYPSIYYLRSFLRKQGHKAKPIDHSIELFHRIFCGEGIERIFERARKNYGEMNSGQMKQLRLTVERFLSEAPLWTAVIGRLNSFLRGGDREFAHLVSQANGSLPGGPRFDACLDSMRGRFPTDSAAQAASHLLADLADFITVTVDPSFSLVRYAESLSTCDGGFKAIEEKQNGYILKEFYSQLLEETWQSLSKSFAPPEPLILLISVPFPGCLAGALAAAKSAKRRFGDKAVTVCGGAYVNTELRFLSEKHFFDYFDYLAFDRGYGSLKAILDRLAGSGKHGIKNTGRAKSATAVSETPLYKTIYRSRDKSRLIAGPYIASPAASPSPEPFPANEYALYENIDRDSVRCVFPDYSGVDFSRYLYPVDDANPMHRLWSDGHWLKAYLAHGCYWHSCAFCDVQLDYINGFAPVDADMFFAHFLKQAEKTGVRGVHLVDEAAPPEALTRLAELNRRAGLPLVFWGNIRFEKDFTGDLAAFLASGGLLGVSAGIELASEKGLKRIGKGISLDGIVNAAAAFKEAGVMVHAYLIYGYWDEGPSEIIDAAEIMRQLFAHGLLDSAYWHKFVLTIHSRLYAEKKRGLHSGLKIIDERSGFAHNDLRFNGEAKYERYAIPLNRLLAAWMSGETSFPVQEAFPFKMPCPSVPPDMVLSLLDSYARARDTLRGTPPDACPGGLSGVRPCGGVYFLGSRPVLRSASSGPELFWRWRLTDCRLDSRGISPAENIEQVGELLELAAGGMQAAYFYGRLGFICKDKARKIWRHLRKNGLVYIHKRAQ